jgi:hypothetical protein
MKRALSLLFGTLVVAGGGAAHAFVRTTTDKGAAVRWSRSCVIVAAHTANPPPNLTPDLVVTAARAAAAAWGHEQLACSGFEIQVATEDNSDAVAANDAKNNLVFRRTQWLYEPSALAITTVFARQETGVVLDADLEINALDGGRFLWGDLVAGVGTGAHVEDLQNTLTHEFGHLLGLDHNCFLSGTSRRGFDNNGQPVPECDRAPQEIQDATMFAAVAPGDTARRTLSPDDIAGVCAIYPAASATTCTSGGGGDDGGLAGGCSMGRGRAGAAGLLAAALVLSAGLRRRWRRRG